MKKSMFDLAEECLAHAKDFSGQLLLYSYVVLVLMMHIFWGSFEYFYQPALPILFLNHSSAGKADKMAQLAASADKAGKFNVAFISLLLLGQTDACIELLMKSRRLPEAALFARTYAPHRVSEITQLWKDSLKGSNAKIAQSLADPAEYPNLFPGFDEQLAAEQYLR